MEDQGTVPTVEELREEDRISKIPKRVCHMRTTAEQFLERLEEHCPVHVRHARAVEEEMFQEMKDDLAELLHKALVKYADPETPDRTHLVYHVLAYDNLVCLLGALLAEKLPGNLAVTMSTEVQTHALSHLMEGRKDLTGGLDLGSEDPVGSLMRALFGSLEKLEQAASAFGKDSQGVPQEEEPEDSTVNRSVTG